MNRENVLIILLTFLCLVSAITLNQGAFIALCCSFVLFGFHIHSTKNKFERIEKFEATILDLTNKQKNLEERIAIMQTLGGRRG